MQPPPYGEGTAALDLANRSGVCLGIPFEAPVCCTWVLGDENSTRAERFVKLRAKLLMFLHRHRPKIVFIEEPMKPHVGYHRGTTIHSQINLTGYVAIAEMLCEQEGIETRLYDRQDVLGHFTGQKRYKDNQDGKRACAARCHQLKWKTEGFDESDAAALWDYGNAKSNPKSYALAGVGRPHIGGSILSVGNIPGTRKARGRGKQGGKRSLPLFRDGGK